MSDETKLKFLDQKFIVEVISTIGFLILGIITGGSQIMIYMIALGLGFSLGKLIANSKRNKLKLFRKLYKDSQ